MLAEVLLLLSGHQSSLFVPHPSSSSSSSPASTTLIVSPHLTEYLHPGEITSLNSLADLSCKYRKIKSWADDTQRRGREAILSESVRSTSSRKGKQRQDTTTGSEDDLPNQYLTTLATSILSILRDYEVSIVDIESKILSLDPTLVQDGDNKGYVPLSSLVANFDKWKIPLSSLSTLVDELSPSTHTPGKLIDLVESKGKTGNPRLSKIYSDISSALHNLFLVHLISFLLYGITTSSSSKISTSMINSIGIDAGSDPSSPKYRIYVLDDHIIPSSTDRKTKESILYIGRVSATLKRENRSLPKSIVDGIKDEIMGVKGLDKLSGFDEAIQRARADIGEWLWKNILTGPQIVESIECLSNYFLTRKSDYTLSLMTEIDKLRLTKLVLSNPHSSSSVIREQDLDLALLRSSLGTTAENDKFLDKLRWKVDNGPLRAIPSKTPPITHVTQTEEKEKSHISRLFSSTLLGTPLTLTTSISWPLDLFLSPKSMMIYSDIHSYLLSFRYTLMKLSNTWLNLSNHQRQNHKDLDQKSQVEKRLDKICWGTIRQMNWFISELLTHFMDIIEVQHRHLLQRLDIQDEKRSLNRSSSKGSLRGSTIGRSSIGPLKGKDLVPKSPLSESHTTNWEDRTNTNTYKSNKAPPTPNKGEKNYLDFLTLRSIHSQHLAFLLEALLLSDPSVSPLIRDILDTCRRFTSLADRWYNESPDSEQNTTSMDQLIQQRIENVKEIDETLHDHILDFFSILLDSQNPSTSSEGDKDKSSLEGGGGKSFSRTSKMNQISKIMISRQTSFVGSRSTQASKSKMENGNTFGSNTGMVGMGLERHVEHLLLRLDFNGILTKWKEDEMNGIRGDNETDYKSVLAQGGL
ncbi:hypothetical protein I204_01958 [Kwoniella mangroviensis CBS 8886]|uniref:uncharacterized protein n=1 Tax=Kwoniella mangroviensis CBS 8507 TaxID=1296122 RepID=UPI00080D28DD|nr:uncharacterized protein I203_03735 [Kwoniella mangroviensis CBS 8507]OCF67051.1 hypothetical protein I203_03735 [Kwoniella mangroviensis CBS 8507]OCF77954.1 hypothetical protein I204_01958 [Kwoniella mangroviensis CBS 8886]